MNVVHAEDNGQRMSAIGCQSSHPRGRVVGVSEVPGSIPGSTVGIFPEGEDSRGDHVLRRLVEFRFKGPPVTPSSYIITHIIGTT